MSPRAAAFAVKFDPKAKGKKPWYVSIPPAYSSTGKRQRRFFADPEEAKAWADKKRTAAEISRKNAAKVDPELVSAVAQFADILSDYDLCVSQVLSEKVNELQLKEHMSTFGAVFNTYVEHHAHTWGKSHVKSWNTLAKLVEPIMGNSNWEMGVEFWRDWLDEVATERNWAPRSYNLYLTLLKSVMAYGVKTGELESNPLELIKARKIPRKEVAVFEPDEVREIMMRAWEQDRELVPYFAIAIFAGLRTVSELEPLTWEQFDFNQRLIRVVATKTNHKVRYVRIEDNLFEWLDLGDSNTIRAKRHKVCPVNFIKRRRVITNGTRWGKPECRDIARHTYGSYLDARYRDRNLVKEFMGHSDFKMFDQHYRNARTPEQAEQFWSIVPPLPDTQ